MPALAIVPSRMTRSMALNVETNVEALVSAVRAQATQAQLLRVYRVATLLELARCVAVIYQNNFEKYRFGVCFVTCSRPPRRDFKLSVGVHDAPKTSRTRCDNVRTTTSPYEKVCVKFQNN